MKKRFYFISTIMLSATLLSLSSCLKDSRYVDFGAVGTTIELPIEAYHGQGSLIPEALPISSTPQVVPLIVNVASPKPLSSALSVTLAVDPAALTAYNTANGTSYTLLPPADYSVSSLTVTVPANGREATLNINVNTNLIDLTQHYVLPITIASASGQQISNYNTVLYSILLKNQWDGTYQASGVRHHPTAGNFSFNYPVYMGTASANSIEGGALADLGADLILTIAPDNTVTVTSGPSGQPSTANQAGTSNVYDPATKTFTLHYFYNVAAPRKIDETLVYLHP
jgi:hypothetical protein